MSISFNQYNAMRLVIYTENKIIYHDLRTTENVLDQASPKVLLVSIMGIFWIKPA
jgi:hypothetical protein